MQEYSRLYTGVYRGKVESNIDSEGLGRCRVRVPSIHGPLNYPASALPWSRPIVPTPISEGRGSVNIPNIGDTVWVFFEEGRKEHPVYIGGTYAIGEIPVDNDIVYLYLENGDYISYNRGDGSYTIKAKGHHITISGSGIHMLGDVSIDGDVRVSGNIKATGEVEGSGVRLSSHVHGVGEMTTSSPLK